MTIHGDDDARWALPSSGLSSRWHEINARQKIHHYKSSLSLSYINWERKSENRIGDLSIDKKYFLLIHRESGLGWKMANVFVTTRLLVTIALMWLIYLCPTVADTSCCADSNGCDESCPWNNACSFGKDYECMEDIGGYLSCQDRHGACQDYDSCSINEAARRAGILCGNKFPYYNGGYPIDSWK